MDFIFMLIMAVLFLGIGVYSHDLREVFSAFLMVLLVVGHFRTRRKTEEGEKFGTPESTAFVSMALGIPLIIAVIFAWNYAMERGGLWWILFCIVAYFSLKAGEQIKKGLEGAVKDARNEKQDNQAG